LRLIESPQQKHRGNNDHSNIQNARYPISERSQGVQDLVLVWSFGLWAALLGLTPVLVFRLLVGS
jgi:hypothetical protein